MDRTGFSEDLDFEQNLPKDYYCMTNGNSVSGTCSHYARECTKIQLTACTFHFLSRTVIRFGIERIQEELLLIKVKANTKNLVILLVINTKIKGYGFFSFSCLPMVYCVV